MSSYIPRNCRPAKCRGHVGGTPSNFPMSTGQGLKSHPTSRCNHDCSQGDTCNCADTHPAMTRISVVRLTLLAYAFVALAIYFSL